MIYMLVSIRDAEQWKIANSGWISLAWKVYDEISGGLNQFEVFLSYVKKVFEFRLVAGRKLRTSHMSHSQKYIVYSVYSHDTPRNALISGTFDDVTKCPYCVT
jgi:hypothetical protein